MPSLYAVLVNLLILFVAVDSSAAAAVSGAQLRSESGPTNEDVKLSGVEADRCTTIAVGPKAGVDGAMATHTMDCLDCDFRISKVPAQDWTPGTPRNMFLYKGSYPNTVTNDRGTTWHPDNLQGTPEQIAEWSKGSTVVGQVPQVEHTYALIEGGYGIMNEYQVAIGESTCASKLWAKPVTAGGKAQIEVSEMSKIALERCKTAREAIQLMGDLATSLGYYAADWTAGGDASMGEGGEGLTVIDKTEAWIFHVTSDDTGTSAIWCAQRVPDDHVAVIANQFIIREIDPGSDDFMYSYNIFEVAIRTGFWNPADGPLDFLKTFGPMRAHAPYATRRVWRVFSLVNPSIKLPSHTNDYADDYPFSVPVKKQLTVEDVIRIQRDHYEGSEFDLTKGLAGGPYGDPNRFDLAPVDNLTFNDVIQGSFERAISLFRTSYSIVAHARHKKPDELAVVWFAQYAPSCTSYTPLYVSAADIPLPFRRGSLFEFNTEAAFWNHLVVGNYAARFYKYAMQMVFTLQKEISKTIRTSFDAFEANMVKELKEGDSSSLITQLTEFSNQNADLVVQKWKELFPKLVTTYHDGYHATGLNTPAIVMNKLFYPEWWLEAVGYYKNKAATGPGVILFSPGPDADSSSAGSSWSFGMYIVLTAAASSLITLAAVGYLHRKRGQQRYEYSEIVL